MTASSEGPQRTCVGCRRVAPQAELARYVVVDGRVVPDVDKRLPGRGSWLHPERACLEAALKRGAFARSQRRAVDASHLREASDPSIG